MLPGCCRTVIGASPYCYRRPTKASYSPTFREGKFSEVRPRCLIAPGFLFVSNPYIGVRRINTLDPRREGGEILHEKENNRSFGVRHDVDCSGGCPGLRPRRRSMHADA